MCYKVPRTKYLYYEVDICIIFGYFILTDQTLGMLPTVLSPHSNKSMACKRYLRINFLGISDLLRRILGQTTKARAPLSDSKMDLVTICLFFAFNFLIAVIPNHIALPYERPCLSTVHLRYI
jgi:hypothetical protein